MPCRPSPSAAAKSASAAAIRGSTAPTSREVARRARRRRARGRDRAARSLGYALYSDRSQIALRMLTRGDEAADASLLARAARRGDRASASRWRSTPPRTGSCTARRICCRRSSSIATATTSSCRRCRRAWTGCCRSSPGCSSSCCSRAGILARNDPRVRLLEGLEQQVEVLHGDGPGGGRGARRRASTYDVDPYRGQKTGLFLDQRENRVAAARLRARPAARLLQLQRRLRAGAGAGVRRGRSRSTSRRTRSRGSRANAAAQRPAQRRGARDERVRRAARARARAASASTRSCSTRRRSPRTRRRSPKALSGYKEINLRALKLLQPGGFLVTCSCSYNVSEAMFADVARRGGRRRARRRRRRREADAGARSSGAARRAGDVLPEVLHPAEAGVDPPSRNLRAGHEMAGACGGVRRSRY